jgi:hypothetical protein
MLLDLTHIFFNLIVDDKDVEFPKTIIRGPALERALLAQTVTRENIRDRAKNVLRLVQRTLKSGIPPDAPEKSEPITIMDSR